MLVSLVAAGLTLLSGVAADIAITYPNGGTTWYYNSTVGMNWTAADTDPSVFRVFIENNDMSPAYGPQELLQEVPTANLQFGLRLPGVTAGEGYVLTFVNTTNTSQEYAKSEKFKIEPGEFYTSSSPVPSSTAGSSSSSRFIPNAGSASTSSNPFATSSGAAAAAPNSNAGRAAAPVAAVALAIAGAALAL